MSDGVGTVAVCHEESAGGGESVCVVCGRSYVPTGRYQLCCSAECRRLRTNALEREKHKTLRTCKWCGKEFRVTATLHGYCSAECRAQGDERRRKQEQERRREKFVRKDYAPRKCVVCGAEFKPKRKDCDCCSEKCSRRKWAIYARDKERARKSVFAKQKFTCIVCGAEFEAAIRNGRPAKYCSSGCANWANYHKARTPEQVARAKEEEEAVAAERLQRQKKTMRDEFGLTAEERRQVEWAQDGDPNLLWRRSQSWSEKQRKFARKRYERLHFAHVTYG